MEEENKKLVKYLNDLYSEDPLKIAKFLILILGKDLHKGNATNAEFSMEADLEESKRFKIIVKTEIIEI